MTWEIERKFLVHDFVVPATATPQRVEQGYIAITEDGTEVRLRRVGGRHTLTVKSGLGLVRVEVEREIDAADFDALWPTTAAARIEKDRHHIEHGPHTIVVDVYHGALHGLSTAEVEFASAELAQLYSPPVWVGEDITGESGYLNHSLAAHGIPEHEEPVRKDDHERAL
jgi:adenylate cyclase